MTFLEAAAADMVCGGQQGDERGTECGTGGALAFIETVHGCGERRLGVTRRCAACPVTVFRTRNGLGVGYKVIWFLLIRPKGRNGGPLMFNV